MRTAAKLGCAILIACLMSLCAVGRSEPASKTDKVAETKDAKETKSTKDIRPETDSSGKNARKKEKLAVVTLEHEAVVLAFVKANYGELSDLLARLKQGHTKEYERAIRDLFRVHEQLAHYQEHDRPRYDLELSLWKVRSRIQLLSARIQMQGGDVLKPDSKSPLAEQLKTALGEQFDLQARLLELEHKQLADRLEKLAKQGAKLQANRETLIEQQFQSLATSAKIAAGPKGDKAGPRPSDKDRAPTEKTSLKNPTDRKASPPDAAP